MNATQQQPIVFPTNGVYRTLTPDNHNLKYCAETQELIRNTVCSYCNNAIDPQHVGHVEYYVLNSTRKPVHASCHVAK